MAGFGRDWTVRKLLIWEGAEKPQLKGVTSNERTAEKKAIRQARDTDSAAGSSISNWTRRATQAGGGVNPSEIAQGNGLTQKNSDEVIEYLVKRSFIAGANDRFWLTPLGKMIQAIADEK